MTAEKHQSSEHQLDKKSKAGDKAPAGTPITDRADNRIQQLQEKREALATLRLTQDPSKGLKIDMGNGQVIEDKRPVKSKAAEQALKDSGDGDADKPMGQAQGR